MSAEERDVAEEWSERARRFTSQDSESLGRCMFAPGIRSDILLERCLEGGL
jgi:hypothetical protein